MVNQLFFFFTPQNWLQQFLFLITGQMSDILIRNYLEINTKVSDFGSCKVNDSTKDGLLNRARALSLPRLSVLGRVYKVKR